MFPEQETCRHNLYNLPGAKAVDILTARQIIQNHPSEWSLQIAVYGQPSRQSHLSVLAS